MAYITVNGASLYYEDQGSGPPIVFAHGLLLSGRMFDAQVQVLRDRYRCITLDFRGQGRSEVTRDGYEMDSLTEDLAALIRALDAAPCHFVGLSMGGMAGVRLAARHPDLVLSLMLLNTSAEAESVFNHVKYRLMNVTAYWLGLEAVAPLVGPVLFGRSFAKDPSRAALREEIRREMLTRDRIGITKAVRGVFTRTDLTGLLERITVPTLVLTGDQDVATPVGRAERIVAGVEGARLVVIEGAGHSSTIEAPEAVSAALEVFLSGLD